MASEVSHPHIYFNRKILSFQSGGQNRVRVLNNSMLQILNSSSALGFQRVNTPVH